MDLHSLLVLFLFQIIDCLKPNTKGLNRRNSLCGYEGGILQSKVIMTVVLSMLLCFAFYTTPLHFEPFINDLPQIFHDTIIPSHHNPVSIQSDSDFEAQDWPGNGSVNNPYRIEDLSFEISDVSDECVIIKNVTSHFIIKNCSFSFDTSPTQHHGGEGVSLRQVSNGRIINCSFTHFYYGVFTEEVANMTIANCTFAQSTHGIYYWQSSEGYFANNTFLNCYAGLQFHLVTNATVSDNTFFFNLMAGILISSSSEFNLTYNLIAYNRVGIDLRNDCSLAKIFGNRIAFNPHSPYVEDVNARDDGYANLWDDNVSKGNEWGDYSGTGVYTINGSAGSVDRFPSLADFDLVGPQFYHVTNYRVTAAPITSPWQYVPYHVSAYDQSGVDTVLLYFSNTLGANWSYVEMEFQPTTQYPDDYSYSFEGPLYSLEFIRQYYFWANDTMGQESISAMYGTWLYYSDLNGPSSPSNGSSTTIVIIMSVGGIAVILTLFILRKKGSGNQWTRIGYG